MTENETLLAAQIYDRVLNVLYDEVHRQVMLERDAVRAEVEQLVAAEWEERKAEMTQYIRDVVEQQLEAAAWRTTDDR